MSPKVTPVADNNNTGKTPYQKKDGEENIKNEKKKENHKKDIWYNKAKKPMIKLKT